MIKTMVALIIGSALFTACKSNSEPALTAVPMQNEFTSPLYNDGTGIDFAERIMLKSPDYISWRNEKINADKTYEELDVNPVNNNNRNISKQEKNTVTNNNAGNKNTTASTKTEPSNGTATQEQPVKKRKGWSNAAKGTVIGAGSGAVVGVIVSKDKVKGGILGGLLGAGVGYVIGNEKDKKRRNN